jgi:hypothetical protein
MEWYGMDLSGLGQGSVDGSCEHGNELSRSIECYVLDYLHNWGLLKKGSAP